MDRGLYIAASGMLAEQMRQDQIANDLANASTPGYKADRTSQRSFHDLLLNNSATGATIGPQTTAVQVDKIVTDFSSRPTRDTGEPLDFAIVGDGFFAVQTGQGTRYTRNGQFSLDAQGRLVTADGDLVLGRSGRTITATNGTVDPRRIVVVALTNPRKEGDYARHRHPRGRRDGHRALRRAGGLGRRPRPLDGGHDRLDAGLRVRPEGHPGHRRDAGQGRPAGRLKGG